MLSNSQWQRYRLGWIFGLAWNRKCQGAIDDGNLVFFSLALNVWYVFRPVIHNLKSLGINLVLKSCSFKAILHLYSINFQIRIFNGFICFFCCCCFVFEWRSKNFNKKFWKLYKNLCVLWVFSHVCKIDLCSALYYVLSFAILFQVFSCICGGSLFFLSCLIIRCLCLFSAFSLSCLLCIHIEGMASPTPLTSCPPVYQWAQNFNKLTALAACACLVSIKNPRALVLPTLTWRSAVGECKL